MIGTHRIATAILVLLLLTIVPLCVYYIEASSPRKTRELLVSNATMEGDQLLVALPRTDFPTMKFGPLTRGNYYTDIQYTSISGNSVPPENPTWTMNIKGEDIIYSISPPPTNQTVSIEMTLTEWPRFDLLSNIVRTTCYRWTAPF